MFIYHQPDDKRGLQPRSEEEEESLFPSFKSSLRRQTATAQLMAPVPVPAPAEEAGRVKPNAAEPLDEVAGVVHRCRPHAHTQPASDEHVVGPVVPPELGLDRPKVR